MEWSGALSDNMLVIADTEGPVAIGGVMGGYESEVNEATTDVLLEAANFDPISIRLTSRRLRLVSEASSRFDKGLPVEFPIIGLQRATKLLVEVCGGTAAPGIVDNFPRPEPQCSVGFSPSDLERVLGVKMDAETIMQPLESLGFIVHEISGMEELMLLVDIPYWRRDVNLLEDIAEEVARIIGYDMIPMTQLTGPLPAGSCSRPIARASR